MSFAPAWGPHGNEIFFATQNRVMAARVATTSGVVVDSRSPLVEGSFELVQDGAAGYSVAADGRFVAIFERAAQVGDTSSPVVILNVFEELRRRLGESTR